MITFICLKLSYRSNDSFSNPIMISHNHIRDTLNIKAKPYNEIKKHESGNLILYIICQTLVLSILFNYQKNQILYRVLL